MLYNPPKPPRPESFKEQGHALEFDRETSLKFAQLAAAAYSTKTEYQFEQSGWRLPKRIERGATQVLVAYAPGIVIVVFPGSAESGDWIDNASAWKTAPPYPPLVPDERVHAGFARQFKRVAAPVFDHLRLILPLAGPDPQLLITGHSLGGALAPLCAVALRQLGIWTRPVAVYSFNAPRIWDRDTARWINEHSPSAELPIAIWRIATVRHGELDLVTRVPMRRWGFEHTKRHVVVGDGGLHVGEDALDRWRKVRDRSPVSTLAAWRIISRLGRSISAHRWWSLLDALRLE